MRSLAGMTVMAAASEQELREVMECAVRTAGTVYFRAAADLPETIEYEQAPVPIDQPRVVREGKDGLAIAVGGMVGRTLQAIRDAALNVTLVNLSILKPVPATALCELLARHDKVATVEQVAPIFYERRVANPRMIVSLKCDRRAPYGLVSEVLEELRKADALRVNFATDRERK